MSTKTRSLDSSPHPDEARNRLLARAAFDAIWVWDFASERISWEGNVESIFGYERDEVVDLVGWWREHVHPEDREGVEEVALNATRSDSPGYSVEYRFRRRDGSWAWVLVLKTDPLISGSGLAAGPLPEIKGSVFNT